MIDFQTLRSQIKNINKVNFRKVKIAILGNYSTQFLSKSIGYSGLKRSIEFEIYNAEYDQIEAEVFDPDSGIYEFKPDFVLLTISSIKLQDKFYSLSSEEKASFANNYTAQLGNLISVINSRINTKIILNNFEIINDQVFGSIYSKQDISFTTNLFELNYELIKISKANENVYLFDLNGLIQYYGAKNIRDWSQYVNADLHFSLDFHAVFSEGLAGFINAFLGNIKKCLVLDLDNTLWGGIIGDDGLQGIEIGSLGTGKSFTQLQKWIKQLKERGIIIAVCSKNTESVAKEPFEKHAEMELRLDDIAVFIANWENKADNIRSIQSILNIGFDSMVFIDDNPAERDIIRQNLPEICVPELPEDPALYLDFLKSLNLFETASFSNGDKDRTKQYQQEAERQKLQFSMTDIGQYLTSLDMRINIGNFQPSDIHRIAQLSQRSNQFNLRTVRYSENDINAIENDSSYYPYAIKLKDKYGDYGLISIIIVKSDNNESLFIENWIMSCRVLKRGVESAALNFIVDMALQKGYKRIVGEYVATAKNALVKDHYENLGFIQDGEQWYLDISDFEPINNYINKEI